MTKLTLRRSNERGKGGADWLKSNFSFSFADYHDDAHMGFRDLRVINEDYIAGGGGFPMHPHRDMEIITYVMEGNLAHKDSLGTSAVIKPGEIQRMSAGSGIVHSEFNASKDDRIHLLQIWILPSKKGGPPSYAQQTIDPTSVSGKFGLIASEDGREQSISLQQDVSLWLAKLKKGDSTEFNLKEHRGAWVQIARGSVTLDQQKLNAGDAANWEESGKIRFDALEDSEILLFDLA